MTVEPGRILLHYRIVDKIGEGGMGAVWRADDTTLDRQVAIKVLPREFAADPQRLARFEREAKLLASLNHPNIAAVYGLHPSTGSGSTTEMAAEGVHFIVMELVAGEDLSVRLARGPLSVDDALDLAGQVCDALEAAHDNAVIHRDLKPANVQLAPDGKVKVLDFGLAKALEPSSGSVDPVAPTVTSGGTAAGVVLGTAAYMSPEQARGEAVDQRADVWAFGCLLFEMLASRPPFHGKSMTDVLAAVIRDEPDWGALPESTPPGIRRLLRRCLAKDPRRRLRHMGDARLELGDVGDGSDTGTAVAVTASSTRSRASAWVLGLLLIAVVLTAVVLLRGFGSEGSVPVTRTDMRLVGLEGTTNRWGTPPIALSPDGRRIAYISHRTVHEGLLVVRFLDGYELRPLPGTEGATGPFFSPDGEWLGFFVDNELRKIAVSGQGTAHTLHHFENPVTILGATWTREQSIIFGVAGGRYLSRRFEGAGGLLEVPATGGAPVVLTTPDPERGEMYHGFPFALPDGKHLVFTVSRGMAGSAPRPALLSRDTGEWDVLLPEGQYGTQPHYLPSGHLVYANADHLLVAPLDLSESKLTRSPVVVTEGVHVDLGTGVTYFALAPTGALLYAGDHQ